jgi:hypothetical protein
MTNLKQLVLCGHSAFYYEMLHLRSLLDRQRIKAVPPDPWDPTHLAASASCRAYEISLAEAHRERICSPDTIAILVVNDEFKGIPNYISPATFSEICTAQEYHKRIFILNSFPLSCKTTLMHWRAAPLYGKVSRLSRKLQAIM